MQFTQEAMSLRKQWIKVQRLFCRRTGLFECACGRVLVVGGWSIDSVILAWVELFTP